MRRLRVLLLVAPLFIALGANANSQAGTGGGRFDGKGPNGVCWTAFATHPLAPTFQDNTYTIDFACNPRVGNYVTQSYNVRFRGKQYDIGGPNLPAEVAFAWQSDATEIVSFQACRKRTLKSSLCTPWSTMHLVFNRNGFSNAYP